MAVARAAADDSTADVHLIGTGVQVIPTEHSYDKWASLGGARERLLDLIGKTQPRNLIILSGDRHLGEISMLSEARFPQPLYEITSSGLTHHASDWWLLNNFSQEPNRYRRGSNYSRIELRARRVQLGSGTANRHAPGSQHGQRCPCARRKLRSRRPPPKPLRAELPFPGTDLPPDPCRPRCFRESRSRSHPKGDATRGRFALRRPPRFTARRREPGADAITISGTAKPVIAAVWPEGNEL